MRETKCPLPALNRFAGAFFEYGWMVGIAGTLEGGIRTLVDGGELRVEFQPCFDLWYFELLNYRSGSHEP